MDEFEKWYDKTYPLPLLVERGPIGREAKKQAKIAWEEAMRQNQERLNLLDALEAAGVDNWDGYGEAIDIMNEN